MTAFGAQPRARVRLGSAVLYLVGIGGLSFSITILWLTMRVVMGIGGSCASGGPYVPAVVCPDAVVALAPLSMFGLFLFGGLFAWGGAGLGGEWVGLLFFGWPALFISLGWNFLEFGLRPPGGEPGELVWSWLFCGVVFVLMGGVPLLVVLWGIRAVGSPHRTFAGGRVAISPGGGLNTLRQVANTLDEARRANVLTEIRDDQAALIQTRSADVATRLERLARLHDAGDLTDTEFEAAKRATLGEAG